MRPLVPWLVLAVLIVAGVVGLVRVTAPAPARVTLPAPVMEPTSELPVLLTALAGLPGSADNPAVVATMVPAPTSTRLPRRDTPTPTTPCPAAPGVVCAWPEPTPTWSIAPTPTAIPTCRTPIPDDLCVMPAATPEAT